MDALAVKQQQRAEILRQYPGLIMKKKKLAWRIIIILVVAVLFSGMASSVIGSVHQSAVTEGTTGQAEYAAIESVYNKALENILQKQIMIQPCPCYTMFSPILLQPELSSVCLRL